MHIFERAMEWQASASTKREWEKGQTPTSAPATEVSDCEVLNEFAALGFSPNDRGDVAADRSERRVAHCFDSA